MNSYSSIYRKLTTILKRYGISLLLGGLLPIAFAPVRFNIIALIIPGLLALLWHRFSIRQAMLSGLIFGTAFFGVGVSWIYISLQRYGGMSIWLAALLTILFVVILALFFVIQALLTKSVPSKTLPYFFIVFPITWVFCEWLRSIAFSGFPWLFLGYSQTSSFLGAVAPIFGIYGVSVFTLWASSAIALLIFDKTRSHKIFSGIVLFFIFTISILLSLNCWTKASGKNLQVSLIQGNIHQSIKWSEDKLNMSLTRYYRLTQSQWKSSIIIWPETAIPAFKETITSYINALTYLAKKNHTVIITGIPIATHQKNIFRYYNGLITIGANKKQMYRKEHLVPFGEYMPLRPLFGWFLNVVDIPMNDQTPGPKNQPLIKAKNINIAPFICYEIAYPAQVLNKAKHSNVILVITEDSWFGRSMAPAQHLQIAQMRARELGRFLLFSTNSGITAVINPNGHLINTLPPDKVDTLTTVITPIEGKTPLMRWHYYPLAVMLLILFLLNFWL